MAIFPANDCLYVYRIHLGIAVLLPALWPDVKQALESVGGWAQPRLTWAQTLEFNAIIALPISVLDALFLIPTRAILRLAILRFAEGDDRVKAIGSIVVTLLIALAAYIFITAFRLVIIKLVDRFATLHSPQKSLLVVALSWPFDRPAQHGLGISILVSCRC